MGARAGRPCRPGQRSIGRSSRLLFPQMSLPLGVRLFRQASRFSTALLSAPAQRTQRFLSKLQRPVHWLAGYPVRQVADCLCQRLHTHPQFICISRPCRQVRETGLATSCHPLIICQLDPAVLSVTRLKCACQMSRSWCAFGHLLTFDDIGLTLSIGR